VWIEQHTREQCAVADNITVRPDDITVPPDDSTGNYVTPTGWCRVLIAVDLGHDVAPDVASRR
jgi:hypothetical protein